MQPSYGIDWPLTILVIALVAAPFAAASWWYLSRRRRRSYVRPLLSRPTIIVPPARQRARPPVPVAQTRKVPDPREEFQYAVDEDPFFSDDLPTGTMRIFADDPPEKSAGFYAAGG
jgi:hypothetical protein